MKIAIVDDHPIIIKGLKDILSQISDVEVVGEVSNGKELLKMIKETSVDRSCPISVRKQ